MNSTQIGSQKVYFFDSPFFEHQGKQFCITGSRITGEGAHDVVHRVKSLATGNSREMEMRELVGILAGKDAIHRTEQHGTKEINPRRKGSSQTSKWRG